MLKYLGELSFFSTFDIIKVLSIVCIHFSLSPSTPVKSSIDSKDDGHFISNSSFEKLSLIEKLEINGSNPDLSSLASSSNTSKPESDSDEKWHCQVKSQAKSIFKWKFT